MTEDEARRKRCCGPPDCGDVLNAQLHGGGIHFIRMCIASECMAWQETADDRGVYHGYCGLAGRPE